MICEEPHKKGMSASSIEPYSAHESPPNSRHGASDSSASEDAAVAATVVTSIENATNEPAPKGLTRRKVSRRSQVLTRRNKKALAGVEGFCDPWLLMADRGDGAGDPLIWRGVL